MKIERPDWNWHRNKAIMRVELNQWFDEHIKPINKMLSEGVEVSGRVSDYGPFEFDKSTRSRTTKPTHKALLINIQPIRIRSRKEKLEELVRRLAAIPDNPITHNPSTHLVDECIQEAKILLEEK